MRFIKLALLFILAALLIMQIVINTEALSQDLAIKLAVFNPFHPAGVLVLPAWLALLGAAAVAFFGAIALEIMAWYEYSRTIRLQRAQIQGLQEAVRNRRRDSTSGTVSS
jgi:hypothetical protein